MPRPSRLEIHFDLIRKWRLSGLFHREIAERLHGIGMETSADSVRYFCRTRGLESVPIRERGKSADLIREGLEGSQGVQKTPDPIESGSEPESGSERGRLRNEKAAESKSGKEEGLSKAQQVARELRLKREREAAQPKKKLRGEEIRRRMQEQKEADLKRLRGED